MRHAMIAGRPGDERLPSRPTALHRPAPTFGMLLAVLGVVYGDIGTSPLYAFKASLQHFGRAT